MAGRWLKIGSCVMVRVGLGSDCVRAVTDRPYGLVLGIGFVLRIHCVRAVANRPYEFK